MEADGLDRRATAVDGRTPAQVYSLVFGLILLLAGMIGFFVNSSFSTGGSISADKLIFFDVNGWHNLVHVASGFVGIAMAGTRRTARTFALGFGIIYGLVFILGLIHTPIVGLIPINGADDVLHALIAAAGIAAWMASRERLGAVR